VRSVDSRDASGVAMAQLVELIRGEPGTQVTLEVERVGSGRLTVVLGRARVVTPDEPHPLGH
jgi:C-terminal processing protease CtpA/Prc